MNDYAPRLRAQQQAERENAIIADLEQRSAPLLWATCLAAVLLATGAAVEGVSAHLSRMADLAATQEAMVQCINGKALRLGDAVMRCEVREYKLVQGVKNDL